MEWGKQVVTRVETKNVERVDAEMRAAEIIGAEMAAQGSSSVSSIELAWTSWVDRCAYFQGAYFQGAHSSIPERLYHHLLGNFPCQR